MRKSEHYQRPSMKPTDSENNKPVCCTRESMRDVFYARALPTQDALHTGNSPNVFCTRNSSKSVLRTRSRCGQEGLFYTRETAQTSCSTHEKITPKSVLCTRVWYTIHPSAKRMY